jgi:hypothetical protein
VTVCALNRLALVAWAGITGAAGLVRAADIGTEVGFHKSIGGAEVSEWVEDQTSPPVPPKDENLIEFYVSATASNRFFIDGATLSVGKDGVVRYTLVVKTSGGATNVTHEGMRCKAGEYRLYASGRADGTWAPSRLIDWRPIENKPVNRHHAALRRDFFCPAGGSIQSADEGRDALKRGKHPVAP